MYPVKSATHHSPMVIGIVAAGALALLAILVLVLRLGTSVETPSIPAEAVNQPAAPAAVVAGASANSDTKSIDLGGGYVLKVNQEGGQIIAPAAIIKSQGEPNVSQIPVTGAVQPKTLDLGGGYTLTTDANGGRINPPAALDKNSLAASSTVVKTYDLGGGYTLTIDANGGQINPPATVPNSIPVTGGAPSKTVRIDIGGGYWLETRPDGTTVITK